MAADNAQQGAGEGQAPPQDTATVERPQDTVQGEGQAPQDPDGGEGKDTTPNLHKLERDIANRDKRIAELLAELKAKEEGGNGLEARIAAMEKQLSESATEAANAKADAALTAAGCVDCELARAALETFDGDVKKLKEAKPYLFKPQGGNLGTAASRPEPPTPLSRPITFWRSVDPTGNQTIIKLKAPGVLDS